MKNENNSNAMEHVANIKKEFESLVKHLREDAEKINDPRAKALFETSAEVILGLEKSFKDFESRNEPAWKE